MREWGEEREVDRRGREENTSFETQLSKSTAFKACNGT
jgi:hypothetical protein